MTERRKRLLRTQLPHSHWGVGRELTPEQKRANLEFRFWYYVDKTPGQGPKGDCWEWRGSLHNRPDQERYGRYGQMGWYLPDGSPRPLRAHVISYLLHYGKVPDGKNVCHHCDNPPCVNPKHLWAGTDRQNLYDARTKGRMRTRRPDTRPFYYRVTLTPEQGRILAFSRTLKGQSQPKIAAMVGMDVTHLCCLEKGKAGRSIFLEKLHFLLRFLEVDEVQFNLKQSQIHETRVGHSNPLQKKMGGEFKPYLTFRGRGGPNNKWFEGRLPDLDLTHYRADFIRQRLIAKGLSLTELSRAACISEWTLRRVLVGEKIRLDALNVRLLHSY